MIKKLLSKLFSPFSSNQNREIIEKYLSQSLNSYDLEQRIRELDRKGIYNQYYI